MVLGTTHRDSRSTVMDLRLEVVVVPVADDDRAEECHEAPGRQGTTTRRPGRGDEGVRR